MKNLDKRVFSLEKSYGSTCKYSHLSDDELETLVREKAEALGYRPANEGEVVEVPEIDRMLLNTDVTKLSNEQLNEIVEYKLAVEGYLPDENIREEVLQCL
jgi:hypothetical protein